MKRFVALAHKDGAGYRIDEMGSVTCNSRDVSNTMASALWTAAGLFTQGAPAGSRMVRSSVAGPGPVVRVVLINDSITEPVSALVRAPAGFGSSPAQSERRCRHRSRQAERASASACPEPARFC